MLPQEHTQSPSICLEADLKGGGCFGGCLGLRLRQMAGAELHAKDCALGPEGIQHPKSGWTCQETLRLEGVPSLTLGLEPNTLYKPPWSQ